MTNARNPGFHLRGETPQPHVKSINPSVIDTPRHLEYGYLEPASVYEPTAADLERPRSAHRGKRRSEIGPTIFFGTVLGVSAVLVMGAFGALDGQKNATSRPSTTPLVSFLLVAPLSPGLVSPSISASPLPVRLPVRVPVNTLITTAASAKAVFASEVTATMCASSAVQMAVEILNGQTDTRATFQRRIRVLIAQATTPSDSRVDGAGPKGMAKVIGDLTGVPYEMRIAATRAAALHDAAATMSRTGQPVILLVWRGAHAWVMTGYRATADPALFSDATVSGTYVLDPWYPRVSTIWGRSDGPGVFQDAAEMVRNYLPWKRPDGPYPGRDGKFIYIAPVETP